MNDLSKPRAPTTAHRRDMRVYFDDTDAAGIVYYANYLKFAERARTAFAFVSAQSAVGSQIIDNLNASTHVRTLLTDLFLLDEALKISGV